MPLQHIIKWLGLESSVNTDLQTSQIMGETQANSETLPTTSEAQAEYRQAQRYEHLALDEYTAYQLLQQNHAATTSLDEALANYQKHARNSRWCLLQAALRGHQEAQYKLGLYYLNGELALDRNYTQAEKWLKSAAKQGHFQAQQCLDKAYAEEVFVPKKNLH